MSLIGEIISGRWLRAWAALAAVCLVGAASGGWAKTPDGMPPSVETVCSGLTGAAFGICNAYCEAQDCDVHLRPSCEVLRRNFAKLTGTPIFPCDSLCGNGMPDPGEDCDPPGSNCPDGTPCRLDCTCPVPTCGNGTIDPGEDCDPPGTLCAPDTTCRPDCTCPAPICGNGMIDPGEECDPPETDCAPGVACTPLCTCVTEPTGCCECAGGSVPPTCADDVTQSECPINDCNFIMDGSMCDPSIGRCVPPPSVCCQCPNMCVDAPAEDLCPAGCAPVPPPAACNPNGLVCETIP